MCGIYGTYHTHSLDKTQKDILFNMFQVGHVRGPHGTGMFAVSKEEVRCLKTGGPPHTFFWNPGYEDFYKHLDQSNIVVGHHRYATKGKVSDENAHPFQHAHITLVHNGTINSGLEVGADDVDSNILCKEIAEVGIQSAIAKITGPYAIVWWDAKEKRLFFIKNDLRPLAICRYMGNFYWASEKDMLLWILKRNYSGAFHENNLTWYPLETDIVYTFDNNTLVKLGQKIQKDWGQKKNSFLPVPTSTPSVSSGGTTGINTHPDFIADFVVLEEIMINDPRGTRWKYLCMSEDNENMYFFTGDPLLGFENKMYNCRLKPGPRINTMNWIDKKMPAGTMFYEIDSSSIIEIIDEKPEAPYTTKDQYPLTKNMAKKLVKKRCVSCNSALSLDKISECVTFTNTQDQVRGLFCPKCTEATFKSLNKKVSTLPPPANQPTIH